MSDNLYQAPEADIEREEKATISLPEELNPWKTIWLKPRLTYRYLLANNPEYMVILLAMLAGIHSALDRASGRSSGDDLSLGAIIGSALVGGVIGGIITLFLGSWLVKVAGSWLGGRANTVQIRLVYAWASVPGVVGLAALVLSIVLFGKDMFTTYTPTISANMINTSLFWGFTLIQLVFSIWSIALYIIGVAEVHEFSKWRAFFSIVIAVLLIMVPIVSIAFLVILGTH
ncbi:MAG: YIP1 family protein [Gammaproteobacteria bacterium]|nr:YIP1 family protein [Gammaproteobacteria bacterium]